MQIYNKKIKHQRANSKYLFIFAFYLIVTLFLSTNIDNQTFINLIRVLQIFLLASALLLIFLDAYNGKSVIVLKEFIVLVVSVLIFIATKKSHILVLALFATLLKNISYKEIINTAFHALFITTVFIVLLSSIGVMPTQISYRAEGTIRNSLGFNTAIYLPELLLYLFLMRVYVIREKISVIELIAWFLASLIIYKFTDTRGSFLLSSVIILVVFLFKIPVFLKMYNAIFRFSKRHYKVFASLPFLFLILSLLLCYLFGKGISIIQSLDSILSGRIKFPYNALNDYGITFFGKTVVWEFNGNYIGIDNSYIFMLFSYGWILALIILFSYSKSISGMLKDNDKFGFLILIFILADALIEPLLAAYNLNTFAVIVVISFYRKPLKKFKPNSISNKTGCLDIIL